MQSLPSSSARQHWGFLDKADYHVGKVADLVLRHHLLKRNKNKKQKTEMGRI